MWKHLPTHTSNSTWLSYQSQKRFSNEISLPFPPPSTGHLASLSQVQRRMDQEGALMYSKNKRKSINQRKLRSREAEFLPLCCWTH